jgi:hypothetical protein
VTVQVGNTASVNVKLQIGDEKQTIVVQDSALQVNTVQPRVQGVLNEEQIENLPIKGRNFLDLAQLEPGVQLQDGANFGKDGFSSISFGGRFGRTARIEVDGVDVSDEIFGATTTNIPASGISRISAQPVECGHFNRVNNFWRYQCDHSFRHELYARRGIQFVS